MSTIAPAAIHYLTNIVTIDFYGEEIPVHLELFMTGETGSVEMHDGDLCEMPTPLGQFHFDIFGSLTFDTSASLGLAEAVVAAGIGVADAAHLDPMTGEPTRTIRLDPAELILG